MIMGENLRNRAIQYYISKGLSPQAAAGIVGMLMSESSLSPDSVNASSGAYGLAQWLGPRKKELFRRYGSKPTFDNQLDYTWYEMNNTHKNALKHLNAAQTPEDAAKAAFGYYAFMTGPEGAIKEMEKYGQNGKASLAQKIKYANDVYNWAKDNTFVVHPRFEKYQNPNGKVEKTYIADTLPEVVVTGNRPKLTLPSISQSQEQAMAKQLLSASGFNPDMPMWEQYTPSYRPLVMPQHYEDGTEGNLPTQNFGDWQKGWLRNRRKQIQENAQSFVESMPGLESLSPEQKQDMILEAESYMYPGQHPEIQQRTPVQNEKIKSIQQKYGYMPSHISPMSPQIDQDQYQKEYDHLQNFRYQYGLDPTKTITPDMIKKWRQDGTLSKENYNFYPDEMLLEYFNEVAANPTGDLKKKWVNRAFGPNRAKLIIGPHYANIKTPRFVLV